MLDLHLIAYNYATHKHAKVKEWLARHPRFHMHFTPNSASWLNEVERFLRPGHRNPHPPRRLPQRRRARGGDHDCLEHRNANPVWIKSATDILEKVARGGQASESEH